MPSAAPTNPVFRFAPSPNGNLHLGHALSAILNAEMAAASNGRFLLRMEDIDLARCKPEFEQAIYDDLNWLGLNWEMPVRRQSDHVKVYAGALDRLKAKGLVYPAFMSRGDVKRLVANAESAGRIWPRDPDGAPLYPSHDKGLSAEERATRLARGEKHVWRLDMEKALAGLTTPLTFEETGETHKGTIVAEPGLWGDVMLWRFDAPSSYHLSVSVDDAAQGVTHVVRGLDLYPSTDVHRLLQHILGLPVPLYHHHRLIMDNEGNKLSKSDRATGIRALRNEGITTAALRSMIGFRAA